jgi:hypothetical protein
MPASRDWPIVIECGSQGVTVSPGGLRFGLAELAAVTGNPLRQTVEQMIRRRQAMARPGEPAERAVIQFRVPPDGLRAYHLAYPNLEPLLVPMTRENVRRDVSRRPPGAEKP